MSPHRTHGGTAAKILDLLRRDGPLSHFDLVARTGLAPGTISEAVRALLVDHLLAQGEAVPKAGPGRSRRLLRVAEDAWGAVGVHAGATATVIALLDFAGRRIAWSAVPGICGSDPDASLSRIAEHVESLLHSADLPRDRLLGAAFVAPGPHDLERGALLTADFGPAWSGYPVAGSLADAVGAPVRIEHEADAAALVELRSSCRPADGFAVVYMGTSIGCSVIADGEVYRGGGNAAAIGHVPLPGARTPCTCGRRGCVEAEAGPAAVVAQAEQNPALAERLELSGSTAAVLADFDRIARACRAGDRAAAAVLEASARNLGRAVAVVAELFGIDAIVLAGPAFKAAAPMYREHVAVALKSRARPSRAPDVRLSHQTDAAAIGGALRVLHATPVPTRPRDD
ncbi:ROK family transcriptional regulator [Glycomyces albidus]|uniref:ROK family protein n=1 Tax=Glycomyces albidus TaxID=2656774 RepID=A0A6L5GDY6_9ACTN|nr:ROK family transcriptional regulator [Glycomyces albidus]MQM27914.1 ROK family protein [Glycomyces albidus]